jgi:hypothetical protein
LAEGEHNKQLCYFYCLPYYERNHSSLRSGINDETSTHNNPQKEEKRNKQEGDQEVIGGQEIKCNSEVLLNNKGMLVSSPIQYVYYAVLLTQKLATLSALGVPYFKVLSVVVLNGLIIPYLVYRE